MKREYFDGVFGDGTPIGRYDRELLDDVKYYARLRGYTFSVSPDGKEERVIRPDGTVAIIARKA